MPSKKLDFIGYTLIISFLLLLSYAGFLSYKSIDWTVLKRLESQKLILPTPMPPAPIATSSLTASPSAVPTLKK